MLLPRAPKLLDSETRLPLIAYPSCLIKALSQESPTVRVSLELGGHRIARTVRTLAGVKMLYGVRKMHLWPKKFFWPSMHSTKKPRHWCQPLGGWSNLCSFLQSLPHSCSLQCQLPSVLHPSAHSTFSFPKKCSVSPTPLHSCGSNPSLLNHPPHSSSVPSSAPTPFWLPERIFWNMYKVSSPQTQGSNSCSHHVSLRKNFRALSLLSEKSKFLENCLQWVHEDSHKGLRVYLWVKINNI